MKNYFLFLITVSLCIPVKSGAQLASDLTNSQLTFFDPAIFYQGATYSINEISLINGDWMNATAYQLGYYNDTAESSTFDVTGFNIQNYIGQAELKGEGLSFNSGFISSDYHVSDLHRGEGPGLGMGGAVNFNTTGFGTLGTGTILESGYDQSGNNNESSGYYADGQINIMWSPAEAINGGIVGKILSLWEEDTASEKWYVDANGNTFSSSDLHWKEDIEDITRALDKLARMRGVSYQWKLNDAEKEKGTKPYRSLGVIAQEVETVLPEVVDSNGNGRKFVSYDQLIPVLIEAVKELDQKQIENGALKNKIELLEHKNTLLEKRLSRIEKALDYRN